MKVVVGLSGGVDSSVAAYLLKAQGHELIGIYMRNWSDESLTKNQECPWIKDSQDALLVAEKLGIPFQVIDLSAAYYQRIVSYMLAEYQAGRTPNPDILCNREIKFDVFLKVALQLGADAVATGHYARKAQRPDGQYQLLAGKDANKDQSYFLCQLNQAQLSKALFPIGQLQKQEVRAIAKAQGLITADKKDSQGLCFVGHIKLPDFLKQANTQVQQKGKVILIPSDLPLYQKKENHAIAETATAYRHHPDMGKFIGEHTGAQAYTVGQRKGLEIGGYAKPLFVLQTDVIQNIIYVGEGENHPALYRSALKIKGELHWLAGQVNLKNFLVRIRYRQALQPAFLHTEGQDDYICFAQPQKAIAAGQFVALYDEKGEELLASGVIE